MKIFIILLVSFFCSLLVNFIIIRFLNVYVVCDVCDGVQKFHKKPVPRIGGVALYISSLLASLLIFLLKYSFAKEFFLVLFCVFPLFLVGLIEDITKKVSPLWRLLAAFVSAGLAFFLISVRVTKVDIYILDNLLNEPIVAFIFTCFAVAGVSHAFNIIDGFNGLASGVSILVFCAYAYVSYLLNDSFLFYLTLVMVAVTFGFFVWNYPFGRIFLGDGGAYFLGYVAAILGVLIVKRNPQVSPWFPLMVLIYPVWETLFSIYRRKIVKSISPGLPDAMHFHSLIFRRLLSVNFGKNLSINKRNSLTSPYLWVLETLCVISAIVFWNNTQMLVLGVLSFIIFYTWLYFRIVRFKIPKFLKIWSFYKKS